MSPALRLKPRPSSRLSKESKRGAVNWPGWFPLCPGHRRRRLAWFLSSRPRPFYPEKQRVCRISPHRELFRRECVSTGSGD